MSNNTETPRTDAEKVRIYQMDTRIPHYYWMCFARQLEIELNDISTKLNELRSCNVGPWEAVQLQREIEDLRKYSEQLISATKKANDEANRRIDELCQARAEAQRLLGVDAKLKDALLEVERLKRDGERLDWLFTYSPLTLMWIWDDDGNVVSDRKTIDVAMAKQPVNSSPERETVANCEQGGQE